MLTTNEQPEIVEDTGTDLIIAPSLNPVAVFATKGGAQSIIDNIRDQAKAIVLDISTPAGRAQVKSVAYKIAKTKTALDDEGKKLKADMQKAVDLVDGERKAIRDALDDLKDEIRKPLTDWEDAEKMRVRIREERIEQLFNLSTPLISDPDVETIKAHIAQLNEAEVFDWQEFASRAGHVAKQSRDKLDLMLSSRIKRDEEHAELERLRKEKEEREQKEREVRIAAEAAAKAKLEAEEKAAAEAKAAQDRADAEKAAIERQKQEAEERAKAAEAKAAADAEAAAKAERDKIEAEKKAEADAIAKRELDKEHRGKINREALSAIVDTGITEEQAIAVVTAIAKGLIPHVKISY